MAYLTLRPAAVLDEESFEGLLGGLAERPARPGEEAIIDCTAVQFVDPFGMVGLLEVGRLLSRQGVRCTLKTPASQDVESYLERMEFFRHAPAYFHLQRQETLFPSEPTRSSASDILLEITPIVRSDDVHQVVETVRERARTSLERHLREWMENDADRLTARLSRLQQAREIGPFQGLEQMSYWPDVVRGDSIVTVETP